MAEVSSTSESAPAPQWPMANGQWPGGNRQAASRLWLLLPLGAALIYLAATLHAAWVETPTVDEYAHVPAGVAHWRYGDLELYGKNPPLLRLWMTLPLALDASVMAPPVQEHSHGWGPWEYGERFLNVNRDRYFQLFFRARVMVILLGLATAGLLLVWATSLYGRPAGAIVASLLLLCPTVLAHAHLATIDAGCTFSLTLTLVALRWACQRERPTGATGSLPASAQDDQRAEDTGGQAASGTRVHHGWWRMPLAGAALGLALAVKFTAVLLLPVVAGLLAVVRFEDHSQPRRQQVLRFAGDLALVLLAAVLVVNLSMGFQRTLQPLDSFTFDSSFMRRVQTTLPGWLPAPLPAAYVSGFDAQRLDTEVGEFGSYLRGRWSADGWWHYNFVALLVKSPESLLLLLFLSAWCHPRLRLPRRETWMILLPLSVLLAFLSLLNTLNIGIRYLLPVLPLLYLLAGSCFAGLGRAARGWPVVGAVAVLLYALATVALAHPSYIGYFNPASGGSARGHRWLLDSNLDWGQDLYRVQPAIAQLAPGERIGLLYFGHVDPALYGIDYVPVPPRPVAGLLAVSVNFLHGYPYVTPVPGGGLAGVQPRHLEWLGRHEPVRRLGSIWIYDTRDVRNTARRGGEDASE